MATSGTGSLAIVGARVVFPGGAHDSANVVCDGSQISKIGPPHRAVVPAFEGAEILDGRGLTLLPGFIDVHVHGGGGADTMDATPDALRAILRAHARHGTTGLLATTMTQSREKTTAALANARLAFEAGPDFCPDGAQLLGIHLEGPYLSPGKPGAQPREHIRPYDPPEFEEWLDAAGGSLKLITLAPEQPGGDALIRRCKEAGIVVSMGHTDATADDTQNAISLGVTHATHLFNAMPPIHHRNPGPIPVLLTNYSMQGIELIADGHHVAPEIFRLALAARGYERLVLVTDGIAGAGMGDGVYDLGGQAVTVSGGKATLGDGTLAGSVLTMDQAIRNVLRWKRWVPYSANGPKWEQIVRLTSRNAADEMRWTQKGRIEAGAAADLVLVGDDFTVHATIVAGRVVYRRG